MKHSLYGGIFGGMKKNHIKKSFIYSTYLIKCE